MKTKSPVPEPEIRPGPSGSLLDTVAYLQVLARSGACGDAVTPVIDSLMTAALATEQKLGEQRERIRQLESLSVFDEVTRLLNRRGFEAELARTLARSKRTQEQGLLVICDLDRFGAVNDAYGREGGDAVLKTVGAVLSKWVRSSDAVARLERDEFGLLLVNAAAQDGAKRMERLRRGLSGLLVQVEQARIPVSASLGYAAYGPNSDARTLMAMAEKALARVKARMATVPRDGASEGGRRSVPAG